MCVCVCVCVCMHVYMCVSECVSESVCVSAHVHKYALGIVSIDTILHFTNTFIIMKRFLI